MSPSTLVMAPGDIYQIKPIGGVPPFTYRMVDPNTFASLNSVTNGLVFAATGPPLPGVVEITDFAGTKTSLSITQGTPQMFGTTNYWYKPGQFLTLFLDDTELVANQVKNASGFVEAPLAPNFGVVGEKAVRFRRKAGPNGHPTLEVYPGIVLSYSGTEADLNSDHAVYMVARRTNPTNMGPLICFSAFTNCGGHHSRLVFSGIGISVVFEIQGGIETVAKAVPATADLPWDLIAGKWDGSSSFQVRRSGLELVQPTSNTSMSINDGIISIGPVGGTPSVDYLEIAEVIVFEQLNSPTEIERYLKDKYSLTF